MTKPTALELADELWRGHPLPLHADAAEELRAQHNALINADYTRRTLCKRVAELEAQLEAVGAGGVSQLVPAQPPALPSEDDDKDDGLELLKKYKKLCVQIGRGDGHHLQRIDNAIAHWGAPQAAAMPERVPLTDEQIEHLCDEVGFTSWPEWDGAVFQALWIDLARKIERAHGITSKAEGAQS